MGKTKAVVLKAPGTNCDAEMAHALTLAGTQSEIVYLKEMEKNPSRLLDYSLCVFPGGFSYGDYLGSGKSFALVAESAFGQELRRFAEEGRTVLGVCNGFQVLVHLGLLPGNGSAASLASNRNGRFMCRWVDLEWIPSSILARSTAAALAQKTELPIANGEGRFLTSPEALHRLENKGMVFLRYGPENPNGSQARIAGITNERGNVIGLMPHPERFVNSTQHYNAPGNRKVKPWGLEFLKCVVSLEQLTTRRPRI